MYKKTDHTESTEEKKQMPLKSAWRAGSLLFLLVLLGSLSLAWAPKVLAAANPESLTLTSSQAIEICNGSITLAAQVLDGSGVPVTNQAVTVTILNGLDRGNMGIGTTDSNGQVSFVNITNYAIAGETIGYQASIVDTASGKTITSTAYVAWVYQDLTVTTSAATQSLGKPVTLEAQVLSDVYAGQNVGFTVLSGPDASRSFASKTDGNGLASVTFVGEEGVGVDIIQAITLDSASEITTGPNIQVTWQDTSNIKLSPPPVPPFKGKPTSLTAQVLLGLTDTPLVNQSVTFTIIAGANTGKTYTGMTDSNGQVVFSYTATTKLGTNIVQASFVNPITSKTVISNTVRSSGM